MDRNQLLNDDEEALRSAFYGLQVGVWTAMPCIVDSVDYDANTIAATPAIQGEVADENGGTKFITLPQLQDVPIVFPSAGGFVLTLPIKAGDEVLVVFASRCIDGWWQSGGIQKAMELRLHDLSDGFAIPGPRSQPKKISNISQTGAQLRNDAGTTYVEIAADGKIKLIAPPGIALEGNLNVTGTIAASGNITTDGDVVAGLITLKTHKHTGVVPGGGISGGPTP